MTVLSLGGEIIEQPLGAYLQVARLSANARKGEIRTEGLFTLRVLMSSQGLAAAALANGGDPARRRTTDFYPTPPEVTEALLRFLHIPETKVIWEPACGNGDMSRVIQSRGNRVISTDLRDTGFGEGGVNFLTTTRQADAIITNPPFSHAEEFIRHALSLTPNVAMLLKSQFWHARKRAKLFEEHPPAYILPLTWRPDFMFDIRGDERASPVMDCLWCVWLEGRTGAHYQPLTKPDIPHGRTGAILEPSDA